MIKLAVMATRNYRLIFTVVILGAFLLLAMAVVGLGYLDAARQSIGHFAPVGDPVNGKHK
jgi:hypothetical protein